MSKFAQFFIFSSLFKHHQQSKAASVSNVFIFSRVCPTFYSVFLLDQCYSWMNNPTDITEAVDYWCVIFGFYLTVIDTISKLRQYFTTILSTSVRQRLEIWQDTNTDNEACRQDFPAVLLQTNTYPFILSSGTPWRPKASKWHPSRFMYGKQVGTAVKDRKKTRDRGRVGPWFGHVLSSGQRTMQSWQSHCLVPEGIECHMVPLMSRASLEGDVGHNACMSVYLCRLLCSHVCIYAYAWRSADTESRRCRRRRCIFRFCSFGVIHVFVCVLESETGCLSAGVYVKGGWGGHREVGQSVCVGGESQFPFAS